jgi:hypothetical protein
VKPQVFAALLFFAAFLVFPPGQALAQEREAGFYLEETGGGFRFIQRLSWEPEEYAAFYEVVVQKREDSGNWITSFSDLTENDFIELSLPPGAYRYQVRAYDLMERPAGDPKWVSFEVLPALRPVLERFSPGRFSLGGVSGGETALILTVSGRDLAETAEFRLIRKSPAGSPDILPQERRGSAAGTGTVLVFGREHLSPGIYELAVVNPGGLSDSLGTLRIYQDDAPRFAVSAGYGPLIPLYGGLHELLDASFFPAGAYGQFSFLPIQTGSIGLGLETGIYWTYLSSPYYNSAAQKNYDVSGHYIGIELYGLFQKTLNRRMTAKLRLGGGIFSIAGFEKKAPGIQAGQVNALIPAAAAGFSLRLFFLKSFFADLGVEYTHFFSAADSPPGYLRPFGGIGFSM